MICKEDDWLIITLLETDNGSGVFIADLLNYIRYKEDISHIVIGDVEGGCVVQITPDLEYYYYTLDSLIPLIQEAYQFDWCDIFCFDSKDDIPEEIRRPIDYIALIPNTTVTLRVIDHGEVEIFTRSEQLCLYIAAKYIVAECNHSSLEEHTYPS